MKEPKPLLKFDTFNLNTIERTAIETALQTSGSIVGAAGLLGITRHAVKRRIIRHNIRWRGGTERTEPEAQQTIA